MADSVIIAPQILLPRKGIDLTKFAVIACDQFTSQIDYWNSLETIIKDEPSSLRLIFPEAYLSLVNQDSYINQINKNIDAYLKQGLLESQGSGFILVVRSTPFQPKRLGLVIAIDLEQYSYDPQTRAPIRASEATIVERIPPRLKIRENASIEIPHVIVLFDDKARDIIEPLYEKRQQIPLVYDFDLNQNGGHLSGYFIKDTEPIIASFMKLLDRSSLLFVVGDGNHSLATAKVHWNNIKMNLSIAEQQKHPARYSLVEAVNIYDEGLDFEPIHRFVNHADKDFLRGLISNLTGPKTSYVYSKSDGKIPIYLPDSSPKSYKMVQAYIDGYLKTHPRAEVDYIHGEKDLIKIATMHKDSYAIVMPSLTKEAVFAYLEQGVVLPRKAFSMGHAVEKRYYLESKLIK